MTRARLSVAVVGAGLSGLVCARTLADHGALVRVFDKGSVPGGRMATRYIGDRRFDHGAQYFTVRDSRFARWVDSWVQSGLVALWKGEVVSLAAGTRVRESGDTERFVGVPDMSSVCRHLEADLDVRHETYVTDVRRGDENWELAAGDVPLGDYDALVVSAPGPQAALLLAHAAPAVAGRAARAAMAPCWAAMAEFGAPLDLGFDGAFVHDSALGWVARNGSKPGRSAGECWVFHATPEWSERHLDLEGAEAARRLLAAFADEVGGLDREPRHLDGHRWRYALPTSPLRERCLFDPDLRVAACGDWCGGPRIEGAFLSGRAAADRVLAARPGTPPPPPLTYE